MLGLYDSLGVSSVATVVISVAFMIFGGFAMTRITKRLRLPNVTAYILAGILMGPFCLNAIPDKVMGGTEFISDIALAFIAFSTGRFFRFSALKKNGAKVILITVFETVITAGIVFLVLHFLVGLNFALSLVLAALAAATASASTMMTIRQMGAKGDFVDTLLQVIALDNVIGLLAYSVSISVAMVLESGAAFSVWNVVKPVLTNLGVLVLGGVFGVLLRVLMPKKRSVDNKLIISVATLFLFCGICAMIDVSPLLGCMSMGMIYINLSEDDKLFKQLNYFSPPILLLFFVRSGLTFRLDALFAKSDFLATMPLFLAGVIYFAVRIVGKYGGAYLGCQTVRKDKKVRNYLGLALVPQAGVAIGLATLGARALGGESGDFLLTVVLTSSILCEMVGPVSAKLALYWSGSYSDKLEDLVEVEATTADGTPKTTVELLVERIQAIQKELPEHAVSEDEQAFDEAAEEQYMAAEMARKRFFMKRR